MVKIGWACVTYSVQDGVVLKHVMLDVPSFRSRPWKINEYTISCLEYITILYVVLVYAQQASKAKLLAFDTWE
jgi:hypothetical protein